MNSDRAPRIEGRIFMRFAGTALEQAYRDHLSSSHRSLVALSLALAALLFAVAEPLARLYFPSDITALDNAVRWYLNLPVVLLALAAHLGAGDPGRRELALLACLGLILVGNAVLLWSVAPGGQLYYAVASVQIALFGFFLLGLRFRPACLVVLACFAAPALGATLRTLLTEPPALLQSPYAAAVLIVAGLAFAACALDRSRRELFLANLSREREHKRRLALERERSRWLRVGSDYLNHEMKNALLGITSSLKLLQRANQDPRGGDYIERAASSARFMQRLLAEVSASASLEAALEEITVATVDLGELADHRLAEYREMYPDSDFSADIAAGLRVPCDVERIIQALDKLVDNAVQHSSGAHPVSLHVFVDDGDAVLSISNRGDSLVESGPDIFDLSVSGRRRTADGGYGFGLYIVRRIAEAHGGSVAATALRNPDGAQFALRLPRDAT